MILLKIFQINFKIFKEISKYDKFFLSIFYLTKIFY
jgi:hypothetical protein